MSKHDNILWVAKDGSYGTGLVKTFNTTYWREKDWVRLDEAYDADKASFAKYITRKRNRQAEKVAEIIARAERIDVRTIVISSKENGLDDNA